MQLALRPAPQRTSSSTKSPFARLSFMANGLFGFFKPGAAKRSPEPSLEEALDRARALHQQGQHADALALCQGILDRHPDHVDALFLAADIAARTGDSERALRGFQKVLELKPDHAPAHYKRGNLLKDRQQLEAALESYDKAIALDARHAYALCNRGVVLQGLGRREAAL